MWFNGIHSRLFRHKANIEKIAVAATVRFKIQNIVVCVQRGETHIQGIINLYIAKKLHGVPNRVSFVKIKPNLQKSGVCCYSATGQLVKKRFVIGFKLYPDGVIDCINLFIGRQGELFCVLIHWC